MTTITKISFPCPDDTMGDTSADDCNAYRKWFLAELQTEYPVAEIAVVPFDGKIQIKLDDDADDADAIGELREFGQVCWDSCRWDFPRA